MPHSPTSSLITPISRLCRLPPRPATVVVQCLESCPEQSVSPHPPPTCAPMLPTHRLPDPGFPLLVERLRLAASTFQPAMACLSSAEDHHADAVIPLPSSVCLWFGTETSLVGDSCTGRTTRFHQFTNDSRNEPADEGNIPPLVTINH